MFTGLIEEIGRIASVTRIGDAARIAVAAPGLCAELRAGDSVAVDGACLTAEQVRGSLFDAYVSDETVRRTTLGEARVDRRVNLERALRLGDRLGGHFVTGHVDATGEVLSLEPREEGWLLSVRAPAVVLAVSVSQGSIAVDGISMTLVDVSETEFTVAVIPKTYHATTLGDRRPGDRVNLESDLLGKHVAKALGVRGPLDTGPEEQDRRMWDLLRRAGFAE